MRPRDLARALLDTTHADQVTVPRQVLEELVATPEAVPVPSASPDIARDRALDAKQAAELTGTSRRYLYAHRAEIPGTKHFGRAVRFSEAGLRRWMRRHEK
jgi:excisionase family DNA binding protein